MFIQVVSEISPSPYTSSLPSLKQTNSVFWALTVYQKLYFGLDAPLFLVASHFLIDQRITYNSQKGKFMFTFHGIICTLKTIIFYEEKNFCVFMIPLIHEIWSTKSIYRNRWSERELILQKKMTGHHKGSNPNCRTSIETIPIGHFLRWTIYALHHSNILR